MGFTVALESDFFFFLMNIYGKGNLLSGNGKGILYKNQHLRPEEPGVLPSVLPMQSLVQA